MIAALLPVQQGQVGNSLMNNISCQEQQLRPAALALDFFRSVSAHRPVPSSSALENISDVLHTMRVFPVQTDGRHVPDGFHNGTESRSTCQVRSPRQRLRRQLYPRSVQRYTLERNKQCPRWQLADWCTFPSSNVPSIAEHDKVLSSSKGTSGNHGSHGVLSPLKHFALIHLQRASGSGQN